MRAKRVNLMTYSNLENRLNNGDVILLDGGTGTELERLGAPMHSGVWCGAANGSHPQLVKQVAERYIAAGADIITTNTYAAGRQALAKHGLADHFEAWNQTAIQMAQQARDEAERELFIAGSIAPFDQWRDYDTEAMRAAYREQAELLAEGKVDFLLLEMLATDEESTIIAIEEGRRTGLPLWIGISCLDHPETGVIYHGVRENSEINNEFPIYHFAPFGEAAERIAQAGGDVLCMMHSEIRLGVPSVEILKSKFNGPIGIYPNSGHWERPNWTFKENVSPRFYAEEAAKWIAAGAQIVGGCCGTGPEHIAAIRDLI